MIPTVNIYRHTNLPAEIIKGARLTGSKLIVVEIYKSLVPELSALLEKQKLEGTLLVTHQNF